MSGFLHGVEVLEIDSGARPIRTAKSSVIGLVGTALMGGLDGQPVLVKGSRKAAEDLFGKAGGSHTIPNALDAIFDQVGAMVVAINVFDAAEHTAIATAEVQSLNAQGVAFLANRDVTNVVVKSADGVTTYTESTDYVVDAVYGTVKALADGTIDVAADVAVDYDYFDVSLVTTAQLQAGISALKGAESVTGVAPRILIAPGFHSAADFADLRTAEEVATAPAKAIVDSLVGVASQLRAVVIADGPNTDDSTAFLYKDVVAHERVYLVDPFVKVLDPRDDSNILHQPASSRIAGIIAKSDNERGFWWSPSNQPMLGIAGTSRPIDFTLGDENATANLLNSNEVATIIRQDGFRLWGNRTTSGDAKWAFLSVRRTADLINDALLRSHLWAVDRNITKTYVSDVVEGVNGYLRSLISQGAIIGGRCWADPDLNTPANIAQGRVYFNFDFTPPYPAEHITFRSQLVNNYLEEVFG